MPPVDARVLLDHREFLRALARSLLRDEARAEDVVQDAYVAALERPPRDPARPRAWLAAVVRNLARRAHRDGARREAREAACPRPPPIPSSAEILAREETRRKVVLAVLALEEPYRSVVVLRYLEEMPPRAIARRLGVPVETVRTRLKRALARLRGELDDACGDRRAWSLALLPLCMPRASALPGAAAGVSLMKTKILVAALVLCAVAAWWLNRSEPAPARGGARAERAGAPPIAGVPAAGEAEEGGGDGAAADAGAAAEVPAGTTILGRVRADGRPLAGAYVYLLRGDKLADRVAATDASGRFHFAQAGRYTLGAAHPARKPVAKEIEAIRGQVLEVDLDLPAGVARDVRVVDGATGAPLDGAEVLVLTSGEDGEAFNAAIEGMVEAEGGFAELIAKYGVFDNLGEMFALLRAGQRMHIPPAATGAAGRVRVGGLVSPRFRAIVRADGYPARLVDADAGDGDVEVELFPGARLTVVAPRVEGAPAAGYVCELDRGSGFPPVAAARFDAEGRATFEGLRAGAYLVTVSRDGTWDLGIRVGRTPEDADGNSTIERSASVSRNAAAALLRRAVTLAEGADRVLDLAAEESARVTGSVAGFTFDGQPWMVRLLAADDREVAATGLDREGRFAFERVPPGRYRVTAVIARAGAAELTAPCVVEKGAREVDVTLRLPTGRVTGLVTGPDGRPLGGAALFLLSPERDGARAQREPRRFDDLVTLLTGQGETAPDGTFLLEPVPPGSYVLFCARGGYLARQELALAEGESRRADVRLDAGLHRVALHLADGAGAPVPGQLILRDPVGGYLTAFAMADTLDDDGRADYVFHLPAGAYLLDVFAEDLAPVRGRSFEVAGPAETTLRLEAGTAVALTLEGAGGPLTRTEIEVRDAAGATVPRGVLPLALMTGARLWRTDDAGTVTLPHLLPGRYTVHLGEREVGAFTAGREPSSARIRVPDGE